VSAMSAMLADRRPTGMPGLDVALAWHIFTRNGDDLIWHNGGTGGYRSFIGFSPKTKVGVVVLSNTSTLAGVDDLGLHVLDARLPTMQPPKVHNEVTVDPNLFDGYVGAYQLAPNFVLTVTREANRLFVQATGQPKFEIFAEAATEYFLKAVDAQLSFVTNAAGQATAVILHQNGAHVTGQRIN
jgi:CubicO group peptidase (beta-lactamase class C family)